LSTNLGISEHGNDQYVVTVGDLVLHTNMGGHHPVMHRSRRFLENLVEGLSARGTLTFADGEVTGPQGFDSYSLFSLQKDWVEPGRDNLTTDFIVEMIHEPLLETSAIPETWQILPYKDSVNAWLSEMGVRLVDLDYVNHELIDGVPDGHCRMNGNMGDDDQDAFAALVTELTNLYSSFSVEQKSVATYLTNISHHFMIYSLRLAAGKCSPEEYGMAFAAATLFDPSEDEFEAQAQHVSLMAQRAVRFLELSSPSS
jgi:hypothetical protein